MPIDVYSVPAEQRTYTRQNLFVANSQEVPTHSIGVNAYQDFAYTRMNAQSYLAMTTGATVVLDQWVEFGLFCSYTVPSVKPIDVPIDSGITYTNMKHYLYCGNTLGFIVWPEKMIHPKFGIDLGIGYETTNKCIRTDNRNQNKTTDPTCSDPPSDFPQVYQRKDVIYPIFVVKPAVVLEANLFSFLQWTLGLRYRFQISPTRTSEAQKLDAKSSWLEISTGPIFNIR